MTKRTATIVRQARGIPDDQGTAGLWTSDEQAKWATWDTQELPDRGNQHDISCVPEGSYVLKYQYSPIHKRKLYHLYDLPGQNVLNGRTVIELHSYNLAGDVAKGYVAQALGCIAPGKARAQFAAGIPPAGRLPQWGVTGSKDALDDLHAAYQDPLTNEQSDIYLTITRAQG